MRQIFLLAFKHDTLLIGHINLLPLAVFYKMLRPKGKVILFAHGIEVWGDDRYREPKLYEGPLLRRIVDKVAIVSDYSKERMAVSFGLDSDKFIAFPNAVDGPVRSIERRVQTSEILVVSRLSSGEREKYVDKVIEAMPKVLASVPEAVLTIVGKGELRSELQVLAMALGVAERVRFLGAVDDATLARAYDAAAVFVLPSSKEGFGIVFLEAWSYGVPVIGSSFGGAGEVITDGEDGYSLDTTEVPLLANRIIALLADADLRKRFAYAGQQKIIGPYSDKAFRVRLSRLIRC
ncbi:glycosyltransferase family 4 protein [Sphingomonas sp. H39-1-10]|uniref:glycosyltransferase family 4 protein n=1 Tax=Sphingomonas pollutisoli TaxID=3030829 RepID=UPI0023BA2ADB|nr:glycosyltransferase family 4 protein [Sphingomonas pollutisoli]MDF0490935.1 glycosyltransferase family 4 protein [Sphingomonas pollutisoli]